MSKVELFNELISQTVKDEKISSSEYSILVKKGEEIGLDKDTVDVLIQIELEKNNDSETENEFDFEVNSLEDINDTEKQENEEFEFRSAITRGGNILTPDIIIIDNKTVTYKKRNKYLINVDAVSIPISKIASVELDTSLWGTDIIIKSYGAGEIKGKNFTKSDAKKIKRIISEKQ
jgi:hypothetical protein